MKIRYEMVSMLINIDYFFKYLQGWELFIFIVKIVKVQGVEQYVMDMMIICMKEN